MMKVTSLKPKLDDNSTAITKTETPSPVFDNKADAPTVGRSVLPRQPVSCIDCQRDRPIGHQHQIGGWYGRKVLFQAQRVPWPRRSATSWLNFFSCWN